MNNHSEQKGSFKNPLRTDSRQKQRGYALFIVLMIFPIVYMLAGTIMQRVNDDVRFTNHFMDVKQARYIAEAGIKSAMYDFAASNYTKFTHDYDGTNFTAKSSSTRLTPSYPNITIDATDGFYKWTWTPGSTFQSFTASGNTESFKYRIYQYADSSKKDYWVIEAWGYYKTGSAGFQVHGKIEPVFKYALFGNETLSEFTRGSLQTINGNVHSNGDLFFRPSNANLVIYADSITAHGNMVRYQDAWGRTDSGGTVQIAKSSATGSLVTMNGKDQGYSGKGSAFDSYNSGWLNVSTGAYTKWGGVVRDGNLGGSKISPPVVEAMEAGGYYEQNADMVITSTSTGTGLSSKTFYNNAEAKSETVKQIDMSAISYPSDGLVIYAKTPIRLVNCQKLGGKVTIVSNSNIYTVGDFNKVYGNLASYTAGSSTKVPAAIMTTQRIYHLSSNWSDASNASKSSTITTAKDDPLYTGDDKNVVEINAALVDGTPCVDEINYVKTYNGVTNPLYTGTDKPGGNYCWANSDDLIEAWGTTTTYSGTAIQPTLKKRGAIVHLENAVMAKLDNSNAGPGIAAWTMKTHYTVPIRDYGYDNDFKDANKQPPLTVLTGKVVYIKTLGEGYNK
ncbi:MAG: hypothetical protein LWY06_10645 [Firmicutes bacterium]|nr:hypothetical protein [Bacillota bacterium]